MSSLQYIYVRCHSRRLPDIEWQMMHILVINHRKRRIRQMTYIFDQYFFQITEHHMCISHQALRGWVLLIDLYFHRPYLIVETTTLRFAIMNKISVRTNKIEVKISWSMQIHNNQQCNAGRINHGIHQIKCSWSWGTARKCTLLRDHRLGW